MPVQELPEHILGIALLPAQFTQSTERKEHVEMENKVQATALEDFVLEELETRLEMAWCCTGCVCKRRDWKGSCIERICDRCVVC